MCEGGAGEGRERRKGGGRKKIEGEGMGEREWTSNGRPYLSTQDPEQVCFIPTKSSLTSR
ncbi:MAG: hypothetical protein MJE68_05170 [Proteobacteria bacterium]|nr:hypothetical protein [Pseudomonadota bacterium]